MERGNFFKWGFGESDGKHVSCSLGDEDHEATFVFGPADSINPFRQISENKYKNKRKSLFG